MASQTPGLAYKLLSEVLLLPGCFHCFQEANEEYASVPTIRPESDDIRNIYREHLAVICRL